jgi:FKBP-type peptidyl-prolyl cis-trans isomerase FkpA
VTIMSELQIETLKPGTGAEAKAGDRVMVHYVGTLTDGKKFDSSRDRGEGFRFTLGQGQVIQGWDQGVAGMKVGETRKLTIPPALGYGARGFPPVIPANATLVFEVELLKVG